jgi:CheY-like chemotaxis protein
VVVEDEAFIRFAMAEALREKGVSVVEAASGDEAWQYLTAGGSVDLVFTDHRMPGSMSGAQLAARIKTQYRIAVIVTSAFFDGLEWSDPIVEKPYDLFEIATRLVNEAMEIRQKESGL